MLQILHQIIYSYQLSWYLVHNLCKGWFMLLHWFVSIQIFSTAHNLWITENWGTSNSLSSISEAPVRKVR